MVEIGSFAGESAQVFIGTGQVDSIICVDIWRYENRGYNNSYPNITDAERRFDAMMAASGGRALKYKGDIDQFIASDLFQRFEGGVDLVYIDALHTYEGCMHDICRTMRFIKPRLAVSGHDYASNLPHVQGVKRAVDDFFGKPDMTFCDSSWIKFNKETT